MMGKTHMAVGLAVSLAVLRPESIGECILAIVGGTVGGVLADSDILDNDHRLDTFSVQFAAAAITAAGAGIDLILGLGICESIAENYSRAITGGIVFAVLFVLGILSSHRTFTHSLTALLLYTAALGMICPALCPCFAVAYASHLVLDLTNKKRIPLLYPMKFGVCFKLFYADGLANRLFMTVGFAASAVLLGVGILVSCL